MNIITNYLKITKDELQKNYKINKIENKNGLLLFKKEKIALGSLGFKYILNYNITIYYNFIIIKDYIKYLFYYYDKKYKILLNYNESIPKSPLYLLAFVLRSPNIYCYVNIGCKFFNINKYMENYKSIFIDNSKFLYKNYNIYYIENIILLKNKKIKCLCIVYNKFIYKYYIIYKYYYNIYINKIKYILKSQNIIKKIMYHYYHFNILYYLI